MLEILDFGYPQNSDIDALKMYITTESIKSERAVVRTSTLFILTCVVGRLVTDYYPGNRRHVLSSK